MPGKHWRPREVSKLRKLLRQNVSVRLMQIGKRTAFSIREKATRLGLIGNGVYRRPWLPENEAKLRHLVGQKVSVPQMVKMEGGLEGYTPGSVRTKISRLKLADPERSQRARSVVHLTREQLPVFHEFLSLLVTVCPPEQIAILWNERHTPKVATSGVRYHLTKILHINRPWSEVMQMKYSKDKRKHRSRKLIKSRRERWKRFWKVLKKKFKDEAKRLRSMPRCQRVPERVCRTCRKKWPISRPFYRSYKKWTRKAWSVNFHYICRICENEKRRTAARAKKRKKTNIARQT